VSDVSRDRSATTPVTIRRTPTTATKTPPPSSLAKSTASTYSGTPTSPVVIVARTTNDGSACSPENAVRGRQDPMPSLASLMSSR
jgi:hypothetical protein